MGHRMLPIAFFPTDPRCHGNEIWDKGHRMLPIAFFPTDPRCHGNEVWDKMGYNLACVGDFCDIFAPIEGILGMGY